MFLKIWDFLFIWKAIKQAFQNSDNGDETLCVEILLTLYIPGFFPDLYSSSDSQIFRTNGWSQHHLLLHRLNNIDNIYRVFKILILCLLAVELVTIDIFFASSKKWSYVHSVVHFYTYVYWATANPESKHVQFRPRVAFWWPLKNLPRVGYARLIRSSIGNFP